MSVSVSPSVSASVRYPHVIYCCYGMLLVAMQTVPLSIEDVEGAEHSAILDSENVSTCDRRRHKCWFVTHVAVRFQHVSLMSFRYSSCIC